MELVILKLLISLLVLIVIQWKYSEQCVVDDNFKDYFGSNNVTLNGRICDFWVNSSTNYCKYVPSMGRIGCFVNNIFEGCDVLYCMRADYYGEVTMRNNSKQASDEAPLINEYDDTDRLNCAVTEDEPNSYWQIKFKKYITVGLIKVVHKNEVTVDVTTETGRHPCNIERLRSYNKVYNESHFVCYDMEEQPVSANATIVYPANLTMPLTICIFRFYSVIYPTEDCVNHEKYEDYQGTVSYTVNFVACAYWNKLDKILNRQLFYKYEYPKNYCRSFFNRKGVWCFVHSTNNEFTMQYCSVPICDAFRTSCRAPASYKGKDEFLPYKGWRRYSNSGETCMYWTKMIHGLAKYNIYVPYMELRRSENFCRNFQRSKSIFAVEDPWCFTTSANNPWKFCKIPSCKKVTYKTSCLDMYCERVINEKRQCNTEESHFQINTRQRFRVHFKRPTNISFVNMVGRNINFLFVSSKNVDKDVVICGTYLKEGVPTDQFITLPCHMEMAKTLYVIHKNPNQSAYLCSIEIYSEIPQLERYTTRNVGYFGNENKVGSHNCISWITVIEFRRFETYHFDIFPEMIMFGDLMVSKNYCRLLGDTHDARCFTERGYFEDCETQLYKLERLPTECENKCYSLIFAYHKPCGNVTRTYFFRRNSTRIPSNILFTQAVEDKYYIIFGLSYYSNMSDIKSYTLWKDTLLNVEWIALNAQGFDLKYDVNPVRMIELRPWMSHYYSHNTTFLYMYFLFATYVYLGHNSLVCFLENLAKGNKISLQYIEFESELIEINLTPYIFDLASNVTISKRNATI